MFMQAFAELKEFFWQRVKKELEIKIKYEITQPDQRYFPKGFQEEFDNVQQDYITEIRKLRFKFSRMKKEKIKTEVTIANFALLSMKNEEDFIIFMETLSCLSAYARDEFFESLNGVQILHLRSMLRRNADRAFLISDLGYEVYKDLKFQIEEAYEMAEEIIKLSQK